MSTSIVGSPVEANPAERPLEAGLVAFFDDAGLGLGYGSLMFFDG
jgi:hypothetical protein